MNAFYVSKAGPRRLAASVQSRFTAGKGRPAEKHPAPQIEGGLRQMEGLELRLSGLSGGKYVMPGRGARLDANGGVSRGQIQQILSQLNMMRDPSQNMGDKKSRQLQKKGLIAKGQCASYFLVRSKQTNKRPLGIWELQGPNNVQPVLVFTPKTPNYKKRFDPEQIVMSSADHHMAKALERAFKHELATSK